ncbi:Flp pilus assembly protein CpaB [Actinomadura rayongensis]|uniref:Flp pilus assembly protein CpaB n=1 Tax=Actinomadura rayongensis TaxID=1429076 RepID=A0A6I4WC05_9ACTN|nr:Flp pilus assembly protein CpaB [Actinomadura rayongensis]
MLNRRFATVAAALVLAVLGTALVLMYVKGADRRAVEGKRAVDVLVATKAIPPGVLGSRLVADGYARTERMPEQSVPDDVLHAVGPAEASLVLSAGLKAGELIRRPLLVTPSASQYFTVPKGKLAMTIALSDAQRVAGYVKAGSKVAVFAAYKLLDSKGTPRGEAGGARLLMSDIDVLSVGLSGKKDNKGDETTTLVTLAVTQQEAEKIVWGTQGGKVDNALYLGLQTDASELDPNSPGVSSFGLFR